VSEKEKKRHYLDKGRVVYFTAHTREQQDMFFVCRGVVTKTPEGRDSGTYRVLVDAVADRPFGGQPSEQQRALLGRAINKKPKQLSTSLNQLMEPPAWLN
jgi:hypothetical protein